MRTRSAARSAAARAAAEGQPATEVVPPQASTSSPASPEAPSAPQGSPEYVRNVAGRSSQHAPRRVRASRNMKAEGALSSSGEAYYQFHAIPEYLRVRPGHGSRAQCQPCGMRVLYQRESARVAPCSWLLPTRRTTSTSRDTTATACPCATASSRYSGCTMRQATFTPTC